MLCRGGGGLACDVAFACDLFLAEELADEVGEKGSREEGGVLEDGEELRAPEDEVGGACGVGEGAHHSYSLQPD